ncbi:MAG: M20/M25/M40 family metallo-hydrolase [Isosphaerales bacterium]
MSSRSTTRMIGPGRFVAIGVVFLGAALGGGRLSALGLAAGADDPGASGRVASHAPMLAEERLKSDVTYLAADARVGRAPGTPGIEAAADYIAEVFKGAGLKTAPGAQGYFEPFTIKGRARLGKIQELAFAGPAGKALHAGLTSDYTPLPISVAGTLVSVPVVFAGYGITARDESRKLDYDDYAGIDVRGKAVIILRREPRQHDDASPFDGKNDSKYATFQHKATNAFQHGAAAILLVNNLAGLESNRDVLVNFTATRIEGDSSIPFLMLSRDFAGKLLAEAGEPSLAELEKQIDLDLKPHSRELKHWSASARVTLEGEQITTKNVVGVLEGAGPHAAETVIVGGHYDHLGHGGAGSLAGFSRDIHNGADDNASGTAMVLELARRLGARRDPPPRRVVFMAFSGEERGLLGSHYYVEHPLFPLGQTVMMINCDMVGRLNSRSELTMIGTGSTPGLDAVVDALGKSAGLNIKKVSGINDSFGGSDHESFYNKDIPVLFAFTGIHGDYHRPSDDTDRINFGGMARIADYLELIALDLVRRPERPAYVKMARKAPPAHAGDPGQKATGVYFGSVPDYSEEGSGDGVKLSGVTEGGPAHKGGLKAGDVIIRFDGLPVKTLSDYTETLFRHRPGDKVGVVVKRDGKEIELHVTLGSRAARAVNAPRE